MEPPRGWRVLGDGRVWHGPASALGGADTQAPLAFPDTAVVGVDGTDHVLVNLAAAGGTITVGGDAVAASSVRALAVGLATHAWADHLTVLSVAVRGVAAGLAKDRLVVVDSAEQLPAACAQVPEGRPIIVVALGVPAASLEPVVADLRTRASRVVAVRTVEGANADLMVDAHGRLTSRRFAIFAEAARLTESAAAELLEMYEATPRDRTTTLRPVRQPVAPATAPVSLRLLGPVTARTTATVAPERADTVTEILTYLALNPRGGHTAVLAGSIWPRGVDPDVLDAAMGHVKAFLAPAEAGGGDVLRCADGRWSLDLARVRVDWHVLRGLLATADQGGRPSAQLRAAHELVEGPPLAGLPAHRYGWLASSSARQDMHQAVVECAQRLGADDDSERATWALRTGLGAVPACEPLWQQLLRLTSRTGGPVVAVVDEMYAALARHGSPLGAEATTDALVHELLPVYVVPVQPGQLTA